MAHHPKKKMGSSFKQKKREEMSFPWQVIYKTAL